MITRQALRSAVQGSVGYSAASGLASARAEQLSIAGKSGAPACAGAVLDLDLCGSVQQDVVLRAAGVVLSIAARPVIADSVRVDAAVVVECAAGDGLAGLCHGLQPLLAVLVPEVERTV